MTKPGVRNILNVPTCRHIFVPPALSCQPLKKINPHPLKMGENRGWFSLPGSKKLPLYRCYIKKRCLCAVCASIMCSFMALLILSLKMPPFLSTPSRQSRDVILSTDWSTKTSRDLFSSTHWSINLSPKKQKSLVYLSTSMDTFLCNNFILYKNKKNNKDFIYYFILFLYFFEVFSGFFMSLLFVLWGLKSRVGLFF